MAVLSVFLQKKGLEPLGVKLHMNQTISIHPLKIGKSIAPPTKKTKTKTKTKMH